MADDRDIAAELDSSTGETLVRDDRLAVIEVSLMRDAAAEIRRLRARVAELEAGAGDAGRAGEGE